MNERKLIIKGHDKNPFVKFWNWGWGIYYKNPEVWNYIIFGALTTLVSLGTKWLLLFTIFHADNPIEMELSVIISWIAAVTFAYITNRIYVFKSKSKEYLREILSFFGGRLLTLGMEMLIMWFFITFLKLDSNIEVLIITIITQILILIGNYFLSKLFVFKKKDI